MTALLVTYIVVGIIALTFGIIGLTIESSVSYRSNSLRRLWARTILAAPIWPLAALLVIPWVWHIAFPKPEKPDPAPSTTDHWTDRYGKDDS